MGKSKKKVKMELLRGKDLIDLKELEPDPNNPFPAKSDEDFKRLLRSVEEHPEWLEMNKIVYDPQDEELPGKILSGNKRWRCLLILGYKAVPKEWVKDVNDMTEEEKREFQLAMNIPAGEWDWKVFKRDEWKDVKLGEWLDLSKMPGEKKRNQGEQLLFSRSIDEVSQYVVLTFNKDIDWIYVKGLLGLETVASKRQNGKPWSKGIGRVIDGMEAIKKIKDEG